MPGFASAVTEYLVEELSTSFDEGAVASLADAVQTSGLFLLGERHSVAENPRVIYTVMRRLGFRALALEWEPALWPFVDRFLTSGALDLRGALHVPALGQLFCGDGRITAGHFAVLAQLRRERLVDRLILFDDTPRTFDGPWSVRDAAMAESLLRERDSSVPTLVVAGGLHTKLQSDRAGRPIGSVLARSVSGIPEGRIDYPAPRRKSRASARFYRDQDGSFVFSIPRSHPAVLPSLR